VAGPAGDARWIVRQMRHIARQSRSARLCGLRARRFTRRVPGTDSVVDAAGNGRVRGVEGSRTQEAWTREP